MQNVAAIILGGGVGKRLYPLTKYRAKPAVPIAGKYRLVDIPISNCINSDITKIFIVTQFNTASLHRHIFQSYKFDSFNHGYIEILSAEQTLTNTTWYQGTADAVRQNLSHFDDSSVKHYIVLSGDQLYMMKLHRMLMFHVEKKADITIAVKPVSKEKASGLGIMKTGDNFHIEKFVEKPSTREVFEEFKSDQSTVRLFGEKNTSCAYLASMGIYIFKNEALRRVLEGKEEDFGKHIIPNSIGKYKVFAYPYTGYWEDIGTIRSFYEANLNLANTSPDFNLYDPSHPVYTHPRFLPPMMVESSFIEKSILAEGAIISKSRISNCVIGIRSTIKAGSHVTNSIIMGQDFYEREVDKKENRRKKLPEIGIGRKCRINRTIIDKNARIGDGVVINPRDSIEDREEENYLIKDGIVVIPKKAVIPARTVIK
ncbi:glucose-1-phosphate adenylyltransferase [bacterium]|jgi:glucose-1-phosphate adenylyltransferase|nr:glucose-1-phosphate adenylyltransferase [bacterium]